MKPLILSLLLLVACNNSTPRAPLSEKDAATELKQLHSKITLVHGSLLEEFPEQIMSVMFISENDKVLELGANVGRNSCVIASLLKDSNNLVAVESDPTSSSKLRDNRDYNDLHFQIEESAISKVPLIQSGWVSVPSHVVAPGHYPVKTISYHDFKEKYNIPFNVLVADCEGALYYILHDDPNFLEGIDTVIVENDYPTRAQYEYVSSKFKESGLEIVYTKAGGWGHEPCCKEFNQVWSKPLKN